MPEHSLRFEDLTKKTFVLGAEQHHLNIVVTRSLIAKTKEKFNGRTIYVLHLRLIGSDNAEK